jgi:hypothetical protein
MIEFETHHESADETRLQDEPPVEEPPNRPKKPPVEEPEVPPQKPPVRALLSEDRVQRATPHPVSTGSRFSFPLLVGGIEGERIDTETKNTISSNMKNER